MSLNKTLYFRGVFEIKKTQLTGVSRGLNDKSNFDYFLIKKTHKQQFDTHFFYKNIDTEGKPCYVLNLFSLLKFKYIFTFLVFQKSFKENVNLLNKLAMFLCIFLIFSLPTPFVPI